MPQVLVTGANRGLGLGFARHYAAAGWSVIATCRDPAEAPALRRLPGTELRRLDTGDEASIERLARDLGGQPLDLLLSNAATIGPANQSLGQLQQADWLAVLKVNTVGPALLAERLAANILASERRTVVAISSHLGSLQQAATEWAPIYCVSKAGLNMVTRWLSQALAPRGGIAVALSPGWVQTSMGGPGAPLSVEQAVRELAAVIERLTPADSGAFLDTAGQPIPW